MSGNHIVIKVRRDSFLSPTQGIILRELAQGHRDNTDTCPGPNGIIRFDCTLDEFPPMGVLHGAYTLWAGCLNEVQTRFMCSVTSSTARPSSPPPSPKDTANGL